MAYLGRGLDKISNIEVLDNITFTNSAGPYNITKDSTAFVPASANALVISIDGVVQSPSSYTLSVATITFDTSMASTSTMNFMYQIGAGVITTPSDGSVGTAQLATDAVTNIKVADDAIGVAELSATGTASASTYLRGDNSWAAVAADTNDKVAVSADDTTPGYLNGKLVAGTDISLTEGSGGADETLTIAYTGTSTDIAWQSVVTGATLTAVAGRGYPIDTSSNTCTITLPGTASVGDQIIFTDYARYWGTNGITLDQGSLNYQGSTAYNPAYTTDGQSVHIVYMDVTKGWIPISDDDVTWKTSPPYSADFLIIAGGGGGGNGYGGGGGAGGYRNSYASESSGGGGSTESDMSITTGATYTVTIGAKGTGGPTYGSFGSAGGTSSIVGTGVNLSSVGGGPGGYNADVDQSSTTTGGCGGGGGAATGATGATPGNGTTNQGYGGGAGATAGTGYGGGGGGGVGVAGTAYSGGGGNGGNGLSSSITGSAVTRAGGGGAGSWTGEGGTASGGSGGGGTGATNVQAGGNATASTGSGGGGAGTAAGNGADGLVIVRMATANYSGVTTGSPSVATDGSDTVITFTASGSFQG